MRCRGVLWAILLAISALGSPQTFPIWTRQARFAAEPEFRTLTGHLVSASGESYVVGTANSLGQTFIHKVSSTGSLLWHRQININPDRPLKPLDACLRPDGDVMILGIDPEYFPPSKRRNYYVARIASANGQMIWSATISSVKPPSAGKIGCGPAGDTFLLTPGLIQKLSGMNGVTIWSKNVGCGPGPTPNYSQMVVPDSGNPTVYVLAGTEVRQFSGADGTIAWSRNFEPVTGQYLAVFCAIADGGQLYFGGLGKTSTALALDCTTGATTWYREAGEVGDYRWGPVHDLSKLGNRIELITEATEPSFDRYGLATLNSTNGSLLGRSLKSGPYTYPDAVVAAEPNKLIAALSGRQVIAFRSQTYIPDWTNNLYYYSNLQEGFRPIVRISPTRVSYAYTSPTLDGLEVSAIDTLSGAEIWRCEANPQVSADMRSSYVREIAQGVIVAGDTVAEVPRAMRLSPTGTQLEEAPFKERGTLVGIGPQGDVYTVDDQLRRYTWSPFTNVWATPVLPGGKWFLDSAGGIFRLDTGQHSLRIERRSPESGGQIWLRDFPSIVDDWTSLSFGPNGHIYATSQFGTTVRIDPSNGDPIWSLRLPLGPFQTPVHYRVDSAGNLLVQSRHGQPLDSIDVFKFSASQGSLIWQTQIPVLANGAAHALDVDSNDNPYVSISSPSVAPQATVLMRLSAGSGNAAWLAKDFGLPPYPAFHEAILFPTDGKYCWLRGAGEVGYTLVTGSRSNGSILGRSKGRGSLTYSGIDGKAGVLTVGVLMLDFAWGKFIEVTRYSCQ